MARTSFALQPQLSRDTVFLGDLPLSRVLIVNDANYPWLMLVPRREEVVEIIDLDEVERTQLMSEIALVGRALKDVTRCDKLNVAALGNIVPQLHVHLIARRTTDAAWPKPVWGAVPAVPVDPVDLELFMKALKEKLWVA
jgi:diadenosine tetraphosphate (Ap4A) HIT family hydrolase